MSYYWNDGTSLYHYGIRGQKWGIRRFQNPDGTLTEAGKQRYAKSVRHEIKRNAWNSKEKIVENTIQSLSSSQKADLKSAYSQMQYDVDRLEKLYDKMEADPLWEKNGVFKDGKLNYEAYEKTYKELSDVYGLALATKAERKSIDEYRKVLNGVVVENLGKDGKTLVSPNTTLNKYVYDMLESMPGYKFANKFNNVDALKN